MPWCRCHAVRFAVRFELSFRHIIDHPSQPLSSTYRRFLYVTVISTVVPARPLSAVVWKFMFVVACLLNNNVNFIFRPSSYSILSSMFIGDETLFGRRHQYSRIGCLEVSSILERPSHH